MFTSSGLIRFRNNSLVIEIDSELFRYYFLQLVNNIGKVNKPLYSPHITIIGFTEMKGTFISPIMENNIEFEYHHDIQVHNKYYYIPVKSNTKFELLRTSQGLSPCYDKYKGFHITIANCKGLL